ncbi:MAG: M56 family metallopeptidase [Planctomycetaceae bacterium]
MDAISWNLASERWLHWISGVAAQATIVALIALIMVRIAKRLPANFRYMVLLLAMSKFFMPPFLGWPGGIFSQFIPPTVMTHADEVNQARRNVFSQPDVPPPEGFPNDEWPDMEVVAQSSESSVKPAAISPAMNASSSRVAAAVDTAPASPTPDAIQRSVSWTVWVMACWIIGAVGLLRRMFRAAVCLRRIRRQCQPASGEARRTFDDVARSMRIGRVRLLLCSEPLTPMACGLLCPAVIVPRAFVDQCSHDEQRAIFAHELAHHRRLDPLVLWIQGVFLAMWWFHPLAWWLNRTMLRLREQCCDDLVITEKLATKEIYASALVKTVEWCSLRMQLLKYAAPQLHPLRDRITSLFDPATRRSPNLSLCHRGAVLAIAVTVLPGFGGASPASATASQETNTTNEPVSVSSSESAVSSESDAAKSAELLTVGGRVLDVQERPVRAAVWLHTSGDSEAGFRRSETDDAGRFEFKDVAPGWVSVAALGDGYSHAGFSFNLQARRSEQNLNLIVTAPETMHLDIRNEQGEPIAGVRLRAIGWDSRATTTFGLFPELMETQQMEVPESDANGRLSISRLPTKAKFTVSLKHPDYVGQRLEDLTADEVIPVTLNSGDPVIITAVDAETMEPVTDATVSIGSSDRGLVASGPVSDDGTYHTRLPPVGSKVRISVVHPTLMTDQVTRKYRDGTVHYTARMYRTGMVQGRVLDAATSTPVSGIRVGVSRQRESVGRSVTDDAGKFEVRIPAGVYCRVSVQTGAGFYSGRYERGVRDSAYPFSRLNAGPTVDVRVKPGETVIVDDLNVRKLPPIRGMVLMPDGQPAVGALVYKDGWPYNSQRTDVDGRFELSCDQPGTTRLTACHLTEPLVSGVGVGFEDLFETVEQVIRLQSPTEIRGQVVDEQDKPAQGIEVTLMQSIDYGPAGKVGTMTSASRAASCLTDDDGRFRFTGLSRHLRFRAVVGDPFNRTQTQQPIRSESVQPTTDVIQLEPIRLTSPPPETADEADARVAPPLSCRQWLNSPPVTPEMTSGKVVVLQFCDTVTPKSAEQLSAVQELHDLYGDKGCVVIAVFHSSSAVADAEALITKHGLSLPVAIDSATGDTYNSYGVKHVPNSALIGRDGRIVSGRVPDDDLLIQVRQAVLESRLE